MQLHEFFLLLAILLLGARLLSEAAARLGIPSVIGELAAGLILGPSLLGWVSVNETLEIMLFSYLAHVVGAPLILGGFAAGIAMGQRFQLSVAQRLGIPFTSALNRILAAAPALLERLEHQIRPLIHVFTPIFFVMVGVSLNLSAVDWGSAFVWKLGSVLLVIAVAGKGLAGYCIRETRLRQAVIGLSMVPRGGGWSDFHAGRALERNPERRTLRRAADRDHADHGAAAVRAQMDLCQMGPRHWAGNGQHNPLSALRCQRSHSTKWRTNLPSPTSQQSWHRPCALASVAAHPSRCFAHRAPGKHTDLASIGKSAMSAHAPRNLYRWVPSEAGTH